MKKVIKWFFLILSIAIYVIGGIILISDRDPKMAKQALWTEDALSLYRADPDAFRMYSISVTPNYTQNGNFFCSHVKYSPTSHELTLTVRFNKSTLKHAMQDFKLEFVPAWDSFSYQLQKEDGTLYEDAYFTHLEKGRHHYLRIVFQNISLEDKQPLKICFFYEGDNGSEPYGEIYLYTEMSKMGEYNLKKKEIPAPSLLSSEGIAPLPKRNPNTGE